MPRFLIEREIPCAGAFSDDEIRAIATKSSEVLARMAPRAQWVQGYVTDDHIHRVYLADGAESVFEHARCGGFPANRVSTVRRVIDPTTAGRVA